MNLDEMFSLVEVLHKHFRSTYSTHHSPQSTCIELNVVCNCLQVILIIISYLIHMIYDSFNFGLQSSLAQDGIYRMLSALVERRDEKKRF